MELTKTVKDKTFDDYFTEVDHSESLSDVNIIKLTGAKKVLLPITSAADLVSVPAELIGCFSLIFYKSAEDAVYKALGAE